MALKITKSFSSKLIGELTEAVIRIENYRIEKMTGHFHVTIAMFKNESDAENAKFKYIEELELDILERREFPMAVPPLITVDEIEYEYPTYLIFPFTKEIEIDVPYKEDDIELTRKEKKHVIDISVIQPDPYTWAYIQLKEELAPIFGAENIIDC
jgi:hypothetical protein